MRRRRRYLWSACALLAVGAIAGCGGSAKNANSSAALKGKKALAGPQIGVNSFLWRATLDTLDFMPLASADPFGGVIITDWYSNPEKPTERFKATVFILDTRLRADGIKVQIYKQQMTVNGWTDSATDPGTSIQIENAILTRARQLKLATIPG